MAIAVVVAGNARAQDNAHAWRMASVIPPEESVPAPPPSALPPPQPSNHAPVVVDPCRANTSSQAQPWMHGYQARIDTPISGRRWTPGGPNRLPPQYHPWWEAKVTQPLNPTVSPLQIGIAALSEGALRHSSYIQVVVVEPQIRQAELVEEKAYFDWRAYLETTYDDVNDPIGNTLTTGTDATRYKNHQWSLESGLRRRNTLGGQLDVFQQFGTQNDNSRFLAPNPQRTAHLELQYTQPLLRGAGRAYNESHILLARIALNQSTDEVAAELEEHLVEVTSAYWELYRARADFYQRERLLQSAQAILANLESRRGVDAVERQVFRARTAVANRRSEMIRAESLIRSWESELRLLVNDPALVQASGREYTPLDSPLLWHVPLSLQDSLHSALLNRPDISYAIRNVRTAAVEAGIAHKEILPRLDLVAKTYVAGLSGESEVGQPFGDQFSEGRPTYSVGLQFELPLGNRAANARERKRRWELTRSMSQFRLTVEEALTSVENAVREVETSYYEMVAKYQAMEAAQREADYLSDRWKVLPGADDSAALLLENLLDAQERVADEERAMVRAQVTYAYALVKLKREMGTLLRMKTR